ncbi:hypothetical protein BCR42DRAFT_414068 [Absidia repens]|uniref:RING-type E3 ubiquitin transferase n=1 Tax=Absidia repens TaxID=90262 RepID=A0A1X2IIF9_9FUNG|nr:hypothetical protein BCR42DRAFT_414068 [Absidia repens]
MLPFLICYLSLITVIQATILVLSSNDTYMDRMALFGPKLEDDGVIGNVTMAPTSRYGCTLVDEPPTTNWIALVERGHCSFADKVRTMQLSKAKAVVIGDPHFNGWITMYATGDTSDIFIPSVYVAQYQFNALQSHSIQHPLSIQLVKNEEAKWSFTDMMIVIVLSPSIMMVIVFFAWKCREYRRRIKDIAPCHVVSSLPSRPFQSEPTDFKDITDNKEENDDEKCAICLEFYEDDEMIRTLPCRHEFHLHCIDIWLTTRKKFCPICKYNICRGKPQQAPTQQPQVTNSPLSSHMNEHTPLLSC